MKLIYVWIEKFRNISKQGFCLERKYNVCLEKDLCKETNDEFYRITISKNTEHFNLMEYKNIENLTAIVGKNGAGKTSWLLALSELHTSYHSSEFLYIYVDEDEDKFYYECNNVNVADFDNEIHKSEQTKNQPEATIFKIDFTNKTFEISEKSIGRSNKINYTLIRHTTHHMTCHNANASYSDFGRYGSSYKERGIFYKFDYLYTKKARANNIDHNNINLTLTLDKPLKYFSSNPVNLSILPKKFPGEECLFDFMGSGHPSFKMSFMLRAIEIIVLNMNFIEKDCFTKYIDQLNKIATDCDYDVAKTYKKFDEILKIVAQLHNELLKKKCANSNDTNLCYNIFLTIFKEFVEKIPESCFEDSRRISIPFSIISSNKILEDKLIEVLNYFNMDDIESEFACYILEIDIIGLSDGYETISNIYAAIYKCNKMNTICVNGKIILALDEPDCYMHPEWSRRFISDLYEFLSIEFKRYKFEIILTTHSPYILSDIDSSHIIFLEDGKVKEPIVETFGQNIHTLLKNSFFIDSTLGEFAKRKIESVKNYLDKKYKNSNYECEEISMDDAKAIINLIGEPVIKNSLEQKLKTIEYSVFSDEEKNTINYYKNLNSRQREILIKHIIAEEQ